MAFGTGNRSFGPNAVLYSFQIKTKDLPAPIFRIQKKVGDEYQDLKETASRVSGNLISASPRENKNKEGKTIKSVNITLQDKNDVYFVSVGYTFLGRNLYNALLALKTFEDIEIGLYQSKAKQGQTKTFASVSLRQHGETVRGIFDNKKDLPPIPKVMVNGESVSDAGAINAFFEEKMKAWCKVVNAAAPKQTSSPAATESHTETGGQEDTGSESDSNGAPGGDEDVPF